MSNLKIIVLGAHYSTMLGVVRSFGIEGYKVEVVFIGQNGANIVKCSKYVAKFLQIKMRDDRSIIMLLLNNYCGNSVLVPSDDYTSSLIDRYRDELHPFFLMPYVKGHKQGAITHLMDKSVQCQMAQQASLNVAKTWAISLKSYDIIIPDDMVYPCFVKPCVSAERGKYGMCKCDDKDDLLLALKKLKKEGSNNKVLVQEYLDIKDEIQLTGICVGNRVYLPAIIKRLKVAEKSKGCTLYGEVQKCNIIGDVYSQIIAMLERLDYIGLIVVDLIESNEKLYFSELNFRSSGVLYALTMAGINLPSKFFKVVSSTFEDSIFKDNVDWGMRFLNDKVLMEDKCAGYITDSEFKSMITSTDHYIIKDEEDKGPYNAFLSYSNPSFVIKVIRKVKKLLR